jgi:hypothetical protein
VFLSVTISHFLKNENYELCFLAGSFFDQITTGKRYSRLAVPWNVWGFHELGLFWWVPQSNYDQKKRYSCLAIGLQCRIVLAGLSLCFLAGSLIKLQITTKKKVQLSGLLTPFATHITFYFYYVCT